LSEFEYLFPPSNRLPTPNETGTLPAIALSENEQKVYDSLGEEETSIDDPTIARENVCENSVRSSPSASIKPSRSDRIQIHGYEQGKSGEPFARAQICNLTCGND
jgi:hypothetical protein